MEKRDRPELGRCLESDLGGAILAALRRNDDALVLGSLESRYVLIDGNFDLLEVARSVITSLGWEGAEKVPGDVD